jgi:hypothetical protein
MFAEYLQNVQRAQAANRDKSQRRGQIHFNVLLAMHPGIAEVIRGGESDPFHRDENIPVFLDYVERALDSWVEL